MARVIQNAKTLFGALLAEALIDNAWLAEAPGFRLRMTQKEEYGGTVLQLEFENTSEKALRLGGLRFVQRETRDDFLSTPGSRLRLYREGWTMASAAASVRYGEKDFEVDPAYKPFAVSMPSEYSSGIPNRFSGEHVAVLNDGESGFSVLTGFITSADQVTRIVVELCETGVKEYSIHSDTDHIVVDPGEKIRSEKLLILSGTDAYALLEQFAEIWGAEMHARTWDHLPNGWCSWYYYFDRVTENDILENAAWLKSRQGEYPLEYIQLDDGYQAALGDWLACNEKFPHGLEFLAKEIKKNGFKPGIWLAPFLVEKRSKLFAAHPEWMVRNRDGEIAFPMKWRTGEAAILDGTHPEVQQFLTALFRRLGAMGWAYAKLDFLVFECGVHDAIYHDKKATRLQALRRGLEAIRKGFGDDRFILGCTVPFGPAAGIVNAARVGPDITPYWAPDGEYFKEAPAVPNVCRNLVNHCYMNHRLFFNDPDTHIARTDNNRLTENEVILWTCAIWLTGGLLFLSDRFETLAPERAEYAKLLIREQDLFRTRPLDLFDREYPAVWYGVNRKTGQKVVGLFNFEDREQVLAIPLDEIAEGSPFRVRNLLTRKDEGNHINSFAANVPAHSCNLFELA